jgi:hypothetical protein
MEKHERLSSKDIGNIDSINVTRNENFLMVVEEPFDSIHFSKWMAGQNVHATSARQILTCFWSFKTFIIGSRISKFENRPS